MLLMQGFNLHLPIQQNTLITTAPSAAPLDLHNFTVSLAFQPERMRFSICFGNRSLWGHPGIAGINFELWFWSIQLYKYLAGNIIHYKVFRNFYISRYIIHYKVFKNLYLSLNHRGWLKWTSRLFASAKMSSIKISIVFFIQMKLISSSIQIFWGIFLFNSCPCLHIILVTLAFHLEYLALL